LFDPPFCPNTDSHRHIHPGARFYVLHGTYQPLCRPALVQRYLCRTCGRTFSRQTFRADYRDHKPYWNQTLYLLVASGVGIRQSTRNIGMSLRCVELKLRKIGTHTLGLNRNLQRPLEGERSFHLDEIETYEGQRNARPLSVPVLIESESRYVIWAESAPIRPRGSMTPARLEAIARSEERHGPRVDESRASLERTLRIGAELAARQPIVRLFTDEKSSYPGLAKRAFGKYRLVHHQTNSREVRDTTNPLFPINHEEAIMRDLMGRLRRESWLVSKDRRYLDLALQLHISYRNLVRKRFNHDQQSAAQRVGLIDRRLKPGEVLSWRQAWGRRSVHPLSESGRTIEEVQGAA